MAVVEAAVEDHIADTGMLPSTTDVLNIVSLGNKATRDALDLLVKNGRLVAAYEGHKNPTIYLPQYMYDAIVRQQRAPDWMAGYEFAEAVKIQGQIRSKENQLTDYKLIESLLYGTGRQLEDAVARAFRILEFEGLETPYEDPDHWDISFVYQGDTYILDVKGKSKWADKGDVGQLQQWLQKYVDENPTTNAERTQGALAINHFRHEDPNERWPANPDRPPVSDAAERYLQLGSRMFVTSPDIFSVTRQVLRKELTTDKGREALMALFRKDLWLAPASINSER